jgi:lipoyl(octanoyl) transferase
MIGVENIVCFDLGVIDYAECWELQKELFGSLIAAKGAKQPPRPAGTPQGEGNMAEQHVLLCEHPAVYTLGKSGDEGNMLAGEEFLRSKGASLYHIDRGGDITFHGEGQLVGYPILDLEREGMGLREYINSLEQTVIDTVAEYGISGTRVAGAAGVWLVDKKGPLRKICAIGVRSSRYVTMHGFALNANTDLRWFDYINPCGFTDRGVTSIAKETGEEVDMALLKERFLAHFQRIINIKIKIEDYANRQTLGNQATG